MSKSNKDRLSRYAEEDDSNRHHRPNHHKEKRLDHALKTKDINMLMDLDNLEDDEY